MAQHFPINLDPRAGPAWRLYRNLKKELSLYPSVWGESDCRSHYVIWRNQIFLFGRYEDDLDSSPQPDDMRSLIETVRERLPATGLVPFFEIAEAVNAIPWDVLMASRQRSGSGLRCGWTTKAYQSQRGRAHGGCAMPGWRGGQGARLRPPVRSPRRRGTS